MRFSANGYYIERYVKCANCGLLVYGEGIAGERHGKACVYCSPWCVEWAALRDREEGYFQPADRAAEAAGRGGASQAAAAHRHRPTWCMMKHPRFDHGVDLPRDGHPADEDVLLDDLQRGPRLHLRARRRQGRHDRLRRVLPDHDRRHAAADQDLRPGDPVRHHRGRRRHPPQRPLSRRPALPRAHLLQAVLRRRRAARASRSASATSPRSAAWCRAPSAARRPRSSTRACACRRSRSRRRARTSRRSGSCCSPTVRTPRQNYGDLRAMIGAVDLGVARITEIVEKYGKAVFTRTCEDLMDYAERRMRAELAAFPDGKYGFRGRDRERRHRGQALHRRDRPLRPGRRGGGRLFAQLAPGQGADQRHPRGRDRCGLQRHAARHRPDRSPRTRAASGRSGWSRRRAASPTSTIRGRWSPATPRPTRGSPTSSSAPWPACAPERAMASESCTGTNFVFGGNHPDHDEYFACYDIMSGGWGGRFGHDGNDCVIAINGNCRFNPTEVFETRFPLAGRGLRDDHRFRRRRPAGAAASATPARSRSPASRSPAASAATATRSGRSRCSAASPAATAAPRSRRPAATSG